MAEGAKRTHIEKPFPKFESYEEALTDFKKIYDEGQKARQHNNHEEALEKFREAQGIIGAARKQGFDQVELLFKEATLHFAITECLTILQESPREIMEEYHAFGIILENMILSLAQSNNDFRHIQNLLYEGFTFTDLGAGENFLSQLDEFLEDISMSDLSESERATLAMFYFLLTKYIEAIQDFYVFSTKHVEKGRVCLRVFKHAAVKTLDYFAEIDETEAGNSNISQYKKHAETWFEIFNDVMEAKMALYMQHDVGETKLALSSANEEKFWEIIKKNYPSAHLDRAARHTVLYAMELLVEIYTTDALLNMQYYEGAKEKIETIIRWCEELHGRGAPIPKKVLFKANLSLAKIAQKYVLDCMYNPEDVRAQQMEIMRADTTSLSSAHIAPDDGWAETSPDEDDLMIEALMEKMQKALDDAYLEAEEYAPEKNETHRESKEIDLLKARKLMYLYTSAPERALDLETLRTMIGDEVHEIMSDFQRHPLGLRVPLMKLRYIEKIVLDAVPSMQERAFGYYRHHVEAHTIRARINIERAKTLNDYVFQDDERLKEQRAAYDEAYQNICAAFNILGELDDADDTLRRELISMYNELSGLKCKLGDEGIRPSAIILQDAARTFRRRSWNQKFLDTLRSPALWTEQVSLDALDAEFMKSVRELVPHVSVLFVGMFGSEHEKSCPAGILEQNLYGLEDQIRTIIRLSEKSRYAVELRSDLPLTEVEKKMLRYVLLYFEKVIQIYKSRITLNEKVQEMSDDDISRYEQFVFKQTELIVKSMVDEDTLNEASQEAGIAIKLMSLFELDGVDVDKIGMIMRLSSLGVAYKNSPGNQVWRSEGKRDPAKFEYVKLGLEIQRGLIGKTILGNALEIADLSSNRDGFTGNEIFAADMVKLAYELAGIIRNIEIGLLPSFKNKKEFDAYLQSMTKDISPVSIDAVRYMLRVGRMDDFDSYLFRDFDNAILT